VEVNIHSYLQALSKADYTFSALETIFRLTGYTSVPSNSNANPVHQLHIMRYMAQMCNSNKPASVGVIMTKYCPLQYES